MGNVRVDEGEVREGRKREGEGGKGGVDDGGNEGKKRGERIKRAGWGTSFFLFPMACCK